MLKRPLQMLCLVLVPACAGAQEAPPAAGPMTLQAFVEGTLRSNQDALAQRFNVTSAEAQVSINRLMPDPELTTGISSRELYGPDKPVNPTQYTFGIAWTLETGGKRAARVAVAREGVGKAQADLETFLSDLRLSAENAFVDALRARLVLERKQKTLEGFRDVVRLNEIRFQAGDIGGVELAQARVEARRFQGEVFSAQADLTAAEAVLAQLLGDAARPVSPAGGLDRPPLVIRAEEVLSRALLNRVDLVAARRGVRLAESQNRLAQANRWVDLGLSVGVNHTPPVYATGVDAFGSPFPAPMPMSNALSATVSIPLPFSRRQRGELIQAEAARAQARLQLQSMEQRTRADVVSAVAQYEAASAQLRTFHDGILQDTDKVLEGIQFSYRRGNASLLEFIEAQRTHNEVFLAYYEALAAHAKALACLDRLSGSHALLDD
ncbi:MAG: TolC family protein [Geothrix sp.]|nr:TolC family protein [Geothrix sp.]